jgi:sulfatase modifying factor 1
MPETLARVPSPSVNDVAPGPPPAPDMIWIPGRTFRMGSDHHYREERPAHDVRVDGFWIDQYPVTNERFAAFVKATGHVTGAEVPPSPQDYPNALTDMLYAGSLVFVKPPGAVDRRNHFNRWSYVPGAVGFRCVVRPTR